MREINLPIAEDELKKLNLPFPKGFILELTLRSQNGLAEDFDVEVGDIVKLSHVRMLVLEKTISNKGKLRLKLETI